MNLVEIKIISIPKRIYNMDWSRFKINARGARKPGQLVHIYISPDSEMWTACNCRYDIEEDLFNHGLECVQAYGQGIITQTAETMNHICPAELSFMQGWRLY